MRGRSDPHDDTPKRRAREPAPPVPTLAELRKSSPWVWIYCRQNDCTHSAPMAFVPLIIRPHAHIDRIMGFQSFPMKEPPARRSVASGTGYSENDHG
jgi:hypothetical protein